MSDRYTSMYDAGGRWRRWEMESLDEPASQTPNDASTGAGNTAQAEQPALPDPADVLAEIERLRETATQRGHAEGFAAGHAQGFEAGSKEGHEAGLQAGREAGRAEGHAEGLAAANEQAERLNQLVQTCADALGRIEAEAGEALVSLALSVAEQVLRSTLNAEPERILDVIRDVVYVEGSQQGILKLRLNPADMDLVEQFLQQDVNVTQWRLQEDATIERGGCIVETALGSIDATLQTRWQRVVSALGVKA